MNIVWDIDMLGVWFPGSGGLGMLVKVTSPRWTVGLDPTLCFSAVGWLLGSVFGEMPNAVAPGNWP